MLRPAGVMCLSHSLKGTYRRATLMRSATSKRPPDFAQAMLGSRSKVSAGMMTSILRAATTRSSELARPKSLHQFRGIDFERGGDPDDRVERRRALPEFEVRDIRAVDPCEFGEPFLADRWIKPHSRFAYPPPKLQGERLAGC